jgi:formyl-CoA transferase
VSKTQKQSETPKPGDTQKQGAAQKPLAGLKVVELGTLIAGPFCTRIMAEFGAEVIKVESPDGGDPLRKWRKLYEGTSLWWYVQARNKKSVTANLKHPEGVAFVRKLIAEADILVETSGPACWKSSV